MSGSKARVALAALWLTLGAAAVAMGGCNEVTAEGYLELVEDSRGCMADADCVLAGEGVCTCASPVNAVWVEDISEAALELDCENATTTACVAHENVRCAESRCVSDASP